MKYPTTALTKRKAAIIKKIYVYERRREVYRRSVNNLKLQINQLNKQLVKINRRKEQIAWLYNIVVEFTGIKIKSKTANKENIKIAKAIFFKYGVEHMMKATDLIDHLEGGRLYLATEYRRWLTQSFEEYPNNQEYWLRFQDFVKNHS